MESTTDVRREMAALTAEQIGVSSAKHAIFWFALLLTAAAVPIFLFKIPALGDYINHLARMHIIATIDQDPLINQFYAIKWHIIPNLIMDVVVPPLVEYVGIFMAGKLFVFSTIALILSGVFALHYAVYQRLSVWPLVVFLFIYNFALLLGLLNYMFGVGVVLWGITAWIGLRKRNPLLRGSVSLGIVLILFVCHLYAVGLYGLALLCFEVWVLSRERMYDLRRITVDALVLVGPFVVVLLLLMASPTSELAFDNIWNPMRSKLNAVNWVMKVYHPKIDASIGIFVLGVAFWAIWRGVLRIHPVGGMVLAAGVVIYLVMPRILFGAWAADYRLPIAVLFIVIGFARWKISTPSERRLFVGIVVGLALVRFALVGMTWINIDHVYADLRESFKRIERGSTVLVVQAKIGYPFSRAWPLNYAGCLATIDRSSFAPSLFAVKGKQVLTVKPRFQDISMQYPYTLVPKLSDIVLAGRDTRQGQGGKTTYWMNWDKRFDYLLVLYTRDTDINPLPDRLSLLYRSNHFQLYKIHRNRSKQPAMAEP
jgi:hypothetical protein